MKKRGGFLRDSRKGIFGTACPNGLAGRARPNGLAGRARPNACLNDTVGQGSAGRATASFLRIV